MYKYIQSLPEAIKTIEDLNENSDFIALDIETTGLDRHNDKIECVVLSGDDKEALMLSSDCLPALSLIRRPLVLHNFKFDFAFLHNNGIDLLENNVEMHDTMLLHHLLNENLSHALDDIVQEKYKDNYKEVFWSKYKDYQSASFNDKLEYACKDVLYTRKLYLDITHQLQLSQVPESLVEHVHNLALALYETEVHGVKVDFDYLLAISADLKKRIADVRFRMRNAGEDSCLQIELELWAEELDKRKTPAGKARVTRPEFNFDSGKQLSRLIYTKLGLKPILNKLRKPTLDDGALEKLESHHIMIKELREYRGLKKVYGSYIEGTFERQVDGRIYPTFNVNGTTTGRISSSNPNMQQLPREGGVRGIYIPDNMYAIISCDYSQLEVTIAAHYSLDPNLLKIILEGASKHDITANNLKIDRQLAKTLNFAMQYQCSPRKVAEILSCSNREAELIWNKYWEVYAKEKEVIDDCKRAVDEGAPIVNPFGRRRHFPHKFDTKWEQERAYRQAYSSLIQGTGADICSRAFYKTANYLKDTDTGRALFPVHDEIIVMSKKDYCVQTKDVLQSIMIGVGKEIELNVPLGVDCSDPMERWED